jgi:hypothetical protein
MPPITTAPSGAPRYSPFVARLLGKAPAGRSLSEERRESRTTISITEAVSQNGPLKVDRDRCIIFDVKILGRDSQNGREYTRDCCESALPLYRNARVNVDHPTDPATGKPMPARSRSAYDRLGKIVDPYIGADGIYAKELRLLPSHPMTPRVLDAAELMPEAFCLSHNAVGEPTARRNGKQIIESLSKVRSVDVVADGGTTNSLFESAQPAATDADEALWAGVMQSAEAILDDESLTVEDKLTKLKKLLKLHEEMSDTTPPADPADRAATVEKMQGPLPAAGDAAESFQERTHQFVRRLKSRTAGPRRTPPASGRGNLTEARSGSYAAPSSTAELARRLFRPDRLTAVRPLRA